jgi:hypothetical protein
LVVKELGERYGRWQSDQECPDIKRELLEMETPGTGRVPLHVYWTPAIQGLRTLFNENFQWLSQHGAIDGSEPQHQSVIIPNYINSKANCLAGSKYYDVCCVDECETLLAEIESNVSGPSAAPELLADLVAKLPSSTVKAPRALPETLLKRLDEIASSNGGVVPLHGRLFTQFLHHAYPRECSYPLQLTSIAENEELGLDDGFVNRTEAEAYHEIATANSYHVPDEIPWTSEEYLFMQGVWLDESVAAANVSDAGTTLSKLALLFAACAVAIVVRGPLVKKVVGASKPKEGLYYA